MKISMILVTIILTLAVALMSMTGLVDLKQADAGGGRSFWVGVERAGINSHQPGRAWCPNGTFLVAFDQDGPRNYSSHDSPVVGQAMCASLAGRPQGAWRSCFWVGVNRAGINSHQPGQQWCPQGTFLVAFDLDSKANYAAHDSPVVGQAMCCSPQ